MHKIHTKPKILFHYTLMRPYLPGMLAPVLSFRADSDETAWGIYHMMEEARLPEAGLYRTGEWNNGILSEYGCGVPVEPHEKDTKCPLEKPPLRQRRKPSSKPAGMNSRRTAPLEKNTQSG